MDELYLQELICQTSKGEEAFDALTETLARYIVSEEACYQMGDLPPEVMADILEESEMAVYAAFREALSYLQQDVSLQDQKVFLHTLYETGIRFEVLDSCGFSEETVDEGNSFSKILKKAEQDFQEGKYRFSLTKD